MERHAHSKNKTPTVGLRSICCTAIRTAAFSVKLYMHGRQWRTHSKPVCVSKELILSSG
jgi:hypothetical protein